MNDNQRFVRWQAILREQLSYAINLFLAFSVATLGYGLNLLRDQAFAPPVGRTRCLFWFSLVALWASSVLGGGCVINRLRDFRGTARRARGAVGNDSAQKEYLDALGKLTWRLFYWQVILYGIGATSLSGVILCEYGARLRP
jgi:hypothetical protein